MRAVGWSALLHRPLDVERGLQRLSNEIEVGLDLEGLHRAGGLELVDVDHPLAPHTETVERALLEVRLEGAADAAPNPLPVGPLLLLVPDGHGLSVLTDQVRRREADRALADRLDLQQRMLLDRHLRPEVEVTVGGPVDVVLGQRDLDLPVPERLALGLTHRTHRRGGVLPPVAARHAEVATTETPRRVVLQPHLPRPVLVLGVVAVPLREDHFELPVVALLRDFPPAEPVVQREVAEVRGDQLTRVDDVVPASVLELGALEQHLLDRGEEQVLVPLGVEQLLHQVSHTGFLAARPRGSRCVCSVRWRARAPPVARPALGSCAGTSALV